jgi:hypothetical protein
MKKNMNCHPNQPWNAPLSINVITWRHLSVSWGSSRKKRISPWKIKIGKMSPFPPGWVQRLQTPTTFDLQFPPPIPHMGKVTVTRPPAPPVSFDLIGTGSTSSGRKQPANSKCLFSLPPLVDGRSAGRCAGSRAGTKGGKAGRACPACTRCKQLQRLPLSTERGRTADIWQQSSQQRTRGLLAQGGDQCEGAFSLETKVSSASAVTICLNYLVPSLPPPWGSYFHLNTPPSYPHS